MFDSILYNLIENRNLQCLTQDVVTDINSVTIDLLNRQIHTVSEIAVTREILEISNILYNNTDRSLLPLEDGIYDLLLEIYKRYNPNYQVGALPIQFEQSENIGEVKQLRSPFKQMVSDEKQRDMFYYKELSKEVPLTKDFFLRNPFIQTQDSYITKRIVDTKHMYPELVGTLDKCKFVLSHQAEVKGVLNDSNVKIVERDFFAKHIMDGIIDPNEKFTIIAELKYDGISLEADIREGVILSARTRGDVNQDIAADLTPIFGGMKIGNPVDTQMGVKFEVIMTYQNLLIYNQRKGNDYKNCRTAISGLISSSDAWKHRDLMTLVPLGVSIPINDRILEIEFMNKQFTNGQYLRYSVLTGTIFDMLFLLKTFVEEAEYMRDYLPFMYDGVVISYYDEEIRKRLGRSNSVNKYSTAIKFNALKKQTTFTGYTFTVGQDGTITPMIHYNPVEFYGTIHDKSTGHSFKRFKQLDLKYGDIIDVEYVNDVMPYVTKPDNSHNANNTNLLFEFISHCPSCGSQLEESTTGKTMNCNNMECPERNLKRMVSMLDKLNIKDFSEAYLSKINKYSLSELFRLTLDDVSFLGDITSQKFIDRILQLQINEIPDYRMVGALGFTSVASEKWKLILNNYSLREIVGFNIGNILKQVLVNIKGIGPLTAETIANEFSFFMDDVMTICRMENVIVTKGKVNNGLSIRYSGFRDKDLMEYLISLGHDASDKGVTKTTDIVLVPHEGYVSKKLDKVGEHTLIIPVNEFKDNLEQYLKFTK